MKYYTERKVSALLIGLFFYLSVSNILAQSLCDVKDRITVTKGSVSVVSAYGIKMFLDRNISTMYYCPDLFSEENGGGFYLDYKDEGGSGMDSYPNVTVGGIKVNNKWEVGNKVKVGMPVKLKDISGDMHLEWVVSQENALDTDDKWMASINFIFDNYGTETSEPVSAQRDYDLVIKQSSHNFNDDLNDLSTPSAGRVWYFARNEDGSLKPYTLTIDGTTYNYAVRYKFHVNTGDKDDKVHLKFIPYGTNQSPSVLRVGIKKIIQATKEYIQYTHMPQQYRDLANQHVALDNAWLKSINAGYEVYTGESVLKIDKFRINLTPMPEEKVTALSEELEPSFSVYPNPVNKELNILSNIRKGTMNISLLSVDGKLVFEDSVETKEKHSVKLILPELESGMYILHIKTAEKVDVKKVYIQ